jgi:ribonuclease HII
MLFDGDEMESISEIKKRLSAEAVQNIPFALEQYRDDTRAGVIKLIESFEKKYDAYIEELKRLYEISQYENSCYDSGMEYVAGIDEVGRGPLAGPVVTAAVILPKDCLIPGINDSKKLSPKKRAELYDVIMEQAVAVSIGMEDNEVIDSINILQATYSAMRSAVKGLSVKPDMLLVDAVTIPCVDIPQTPIIKGDAKSISIGAASIIAKVTRDRMMQELSKEYPYYDFENNMGYGTSKHIEGIKKHGLCKIHRRSFTKGIINE